MIAADAIATKRFDAQTGADREVQRILLELLNQMDGFDQQTNVKVRPAPPPSSPALAVQRSLRPLLFALCCPRLLTFCFRSLCR